MTLLLPEGVLARLTMVNGSLASSAEIAQLMESFSYQQDFVNPDRWNFQSDETGNDDAALHLLQEGEIVDVYSYSPENMMNVNYLVSRFGWADCELISANINVEQMLLARLAQVGVVNNTVVDQETNHSDVSAIVATANDADLPTPLDLNEVELQADLAPNLDDDDFQTIQKLTLDLNIAEQANVGLQEEIQTLNQRCEDMARDLKLANQKIAQLQSTPSPSLNPALSSLNNRTNNNDGALLEIIEKHLITMIDLSSVTKSGLIGELGRLGYQVQIKLVQSGDQQ